MDPQFGHRSLQWRSSITAPQTSQVQVGTGGAAELARRAGAFGLRGCFPGPGNVNCTLRTAGQPQWRRSAATGSRQFAGESGSRTVQYRQRMAGAVRTSMPDKSRAVPACSRVMTAFVNFSTPAARGTATRA